MLRLNKLGSISYSRLLTTCIGVYWCLLALQATVFCFNIDGNNESNTTIYLEGNFTRNKSSYFGASFTIRRNSSKPDMNSPYWTSFLIGAPNAQSRVLGGLDGRESIQDQMVHECILSSDIGVHNMTSYKKQTCKPITAFRADFNPKDLYSSIGIDAAGLSVSSLRFKPNESTDGKDEHWADAICRPLHSHYCGNSPQLEGGCLLSGVQSQDGEKAPSDLTENPTDDRYEIANLKKRWKIVNPCQTECRSYNLLDLMFVIDGSASITQKNFNLTLDGIKKVSMGFKISGPVKIGVVQYSHFNPIYGLGNQKRIKTEISLGNYTNRTEFNKAVSAIMYQRSSTYTARAINKTVIYDFNGPEGRYPDAGRVMILLTDGESTDGEFLPYSARFAAEEGVISYAVGVGRHFDPKELRIIAGSNKRVLEVEKFSALDKIVSGLQQNIGQNLEGSATNETTELMHCQSGFSSTFSPVHDITYNLDTDKTYPIYLRHGGDAQSYTPSQEAAYAGFSFDVRLKSNKPRILVGQPRAGITEQEESPGALYYCNITLDGITVDNNKEGSSDAENETEVENEYSTTISVVPTTSTNETRLPDSFFLPECKKLEIFDATDSEGRGVDHIVKDDALGLNMARIDDDDYAVCTPLRQRVCPSTLSYSPGACYHGSPDDPKDQSWNFVKWNETKCFKDTVEIIFVVDGSGSIGKANFFFVKEWLVNITKTLINRYGEAVRTEVLQYSDNEPVWTGVTVENTNVFEIPYTLNDAISQKEIQERIENMTYLESQTYTYYALRRTMEVEFPRSQYFNTSKKIVVVLTDGEASDALFLDDWYKKYNNTMKSFAVGIKVTKGTPFYKQLQKIANGGDSDERILSVDDFSKLADITDDLSSEIESTTRTEGAGGASDPSPEEDVGSPLLGTSITTSKEGTVYIGATGMYLSSGVVTQLNTATDKLIDYPGYSQVEGSLPNRTKDSYLGYSVVTGSFDGINATEYVASGAPRHLLRGAVVIYEAVTGSSNFTNEVTLSAPNDRQQIGSYFGASLLSVDVNGDGKDDLFVGAPLFVNTDVDDTYDEGRVFVYISSTGQNMPNAWANGILPPVELFGDNSIGARFGTAMADVGDLNLDGYHDVAIGAPLADDAAGAVYVYFGSETGPKSEPNQIIHAAKLSGPTLQYFGLSLQGNIDVDGNQYPDVFIGAPKTDSLVLLRSRSIVKINVTKFEFTTSNIDINQCTANDNKNCIMIKICLLASGTTLEPSIEVQYNVTVDSNETDSSRRLFFETNSKTTLSTKVKIVPDKEHCKNEVLDMKEDIKSFESSIAARMDVDLSKQHAEIPFSSLRDQSLDTEAHAQTIWETGCESDQCVANLHLDGELILPEYSRNLPKNFTNDERILLIRSDNDRLQARVNFSNDGENSFSTMVKVRYHGNLSLLPVNTIANNFNTGVDCIKEENVPESDGEYMIQTFRYSGGQRIMLANTWCVFQFQIDTHKFRETAEMENITLNVTAYTSSKLANESSINSWTDSVKALYQSNLNVRRDSSDIVVTLGQTTEEKEISSVEEIDPGKPDVDVNFKVTTKGGYSNIPLSEITFTWPNSTKQGSPLLYLYKLECTTDQGKASCNCDKTNVNPFNLTVSGGNSAGGTAVIQKTTTATVASNLGCTDTASTKVMCQSLKCQITNLDESGEIQFRALLRVWTASITFDPSIRNDTTITSTLQVSAAKSNLVYNDKLEKIVLSAESINAKVLRYTEQKTASLPWEIIVASVGAFLLLCIIVLVLWKVGFFKRKSIEDIEREAKEKLDNELNFQDDSERYAFNPAFDDEPGPANGVEFDDIQAGFGVHLLQENSKDGPDYVNGTFEAEHQTKNGGNLDDAQAVNGMQVIYENDKEDPDYDLTPDCMDDTNDSGNDDPDYDMPPDSDQDNSKRNSAATEEPPPSPPQEDQDTA